MTEFCGADSCFISSNHVYTTLSAMYSLRRYYWFQSDLIMETLRSWFLSRLIMVLAASAGRHHCFDLVDFGKSEPPPPCASRAVVTLSYPHVSKHTKTLFSLSLLLSHKCLHALSRSLFTSFITYLVELKYLVRLIWSTPFAVLRCFHVLYNTHQTYLSSQLRNITIYNTILPLSFLVPRALPSWVPTPQKTRHTRTTPLPRLITFTIARRTSVVMEELLAMTTIQPTSCSRPWDTPAS